MRFDRRSFLAFTSTGPLVFGLGDLLAHAGQSQAIPSWWESALKRMKSVDQPGLVFIAPSEVEAVQCGMGRMEVRGREFLRFLTK